MSFFLRRISRKSFSLHWQKRSQKGVSIVEVLVSAILLVIVAMGSIAAMRISAQTSRLGQVNQFTNSRIASDVEQARAIANGLCRNPDGSFVDDCNLCSSGFAQAIQTQLENTEPSFSEDGWSSGNGVQQGSRIRQALVLSQPTVLTLNYHDRDNNDRLVTSVDIIPPAVASCACSADNPINISGGGVSVCN